MESSPESKLERQRKLTLQNKFSKRITIARKGREAFMEKDYITCMQKYNEYLMIIADTKEVEDIYKLSPSQFDDTTPLSELLLISHVFWEMARINEMTPKLDINFQKCLNQFIKFTANQPYQVLNAEMLRKYIKINKNKSRMGHKYKEAYSEILVQSKKCYIATHCLGEKHHATMTLRHFKQELMLWPFGENLVALYYKYSSILINWIENGSAGSFFISKPFKLIITPFLLSFSLLTETSIFKKCSYYLKLSQRNGSSH
jgi:hypothetical protein